MKHSNPLEFTPRPYQTAIIERLRAFNDWALFLTTSGGKTMITLNLVANEPSVMIICQSNKVAEWKKDSSYLDGTVRIEIFHNIPRINVNDIPKNTFIIIDESHNIKTPTSKRFSKLRELKRKRGCRFGLLTATPQHHEYRDYYTTFYLLGLYTDTWWNYRTRYVRRFELGNTGIKKDDGYQNTDELDKLLHSDCIVWHHVEKEHSVVSESIFFDDYPLQRQIKKDRYHRVDGKVVPVMFDSSGKEDLYKRQLASGILSEYVLDYEKGEWIAEFIELNPDMSVLIFISWYPELEILKECISEEFNVYTGKRKDEIDKRIVVANLKSASSGTNSFSDFDVLIFHSYPILKIDRTQAIGRLDRIGRGKDVFVYYLMRKDERKSAKKIMRLDEHDDNNYRKGDI